MRHGNKTSELESICEILIQKHKGSNGNLVWSRTTLNQVTRNTNAKKILIEIGLIRPVSTLQRTTTLTAKGWTFESFDKERQKAKPLDREKLDLEVEMLLFTRQKEKSSITCT